MPNNIFLDKKIILGVTGSIAAYKSASIASSLVKKGATVYPVMTRNATKFIGTITFSSITGNKVIYRQFDEQAKIYHISLPHSSDLMAIIPATANIISKISSGICDDFLTTTAISMEKPVLIAPAMNESMFLDNIFQENVKKLSSTGKYFFINPDEGRLACGEEGIGRLAEEEKILEKMSHLISFKDDLKDKEILITSGGTRESIDSVRYITNRSSGKMGEAIAQEAYFRGAKKINYVTTVKNSVLPSGINKVNVDSAEEMLEAVLRYYDNCDILIMTAAVSDIKPDKQYDFKLRKKDKIISKLKFGLNVNILESISRLKNKQFVVGFAAEDGIDVEKVISKFKGKKVDMIVVNDIKRKDIAFDSEYNEVVLIKGQRHLKTLKKDKKRLIARKIFDEILSTDKTKKL